MAYSRLNALDQSLDIGGSISPSPGLNISDEALGLGSIISGQIGNLATISSVVDGIATITGLFGFNIGCIGSFLQLNHTTISGNTGTFSIVAYNNASSVNISNINADNSDGYNGSIIWAQRNPYSLLDDLNYARTDRANIKGVGYSDPIPTYQQVSNIGTNIPANLANISGKTTDAQGFIINKPIYSVAVSSGNTKITISSAGNFKHSDAINKTGIPCFDTAPYVGDYKACYVGITATDNSGLTVLTGVHAGEKIFGITNSGSSTSPNSVEVIFYSFPNGSDISLSSTVYTWENGQPILVNLSYGYLQRLDLLPEESFKTNFDIGSSAANGITKTEHQSLRQLIHFISDGPGADFASGAYKETYPPSYPFPTSVIWYEASDKINKIVEKIITYNSNKTPNTITWNMYDATNTIVSTVIDTIAYNGIFEINRTRIIL